MLIPQLDCQGRGGFWRGFCKLVETATLYFWRKQRIIVVDRFEVIFQVSASNKTLVIPQESGTTRSCKLSLDVNTMQNGK